MYKGPLPTQNKQQQIKASAMIKQATLALSLTHLFRRGDAPARRGGGAPGTSASRDLFAEQRIYHHHHHPKGVVHGSFCSLRNHFQKVMAAVMVYKVSLPT